MSKDFNGSSEKKEINQIESDEIILDIGPKTIENKKNY